jgi:hypothetical protein
MCLTCRERLFSRDLGLEQDQHETRPMQWLAVPHVSWTFIFGLKYLLFCPLISNYLQFCRRHSKDVTSISFHFLPPCSRPVHRTTTNWLQSLISETLSPVGFTSATSKWPSYSFRHRAIIDIHLRRKRRRHCAVTWIWIRQDGYALVLRVDSDKVIRAQHDWSRRNNCRPVWRDVDWCHWVGCFALLLCWFSMEGKRILWLLAKVLLLWSRGFAIELVQ